MPKFYKGKYRVKNPNKYRGDPTKVEYRSMWERQVFRWLDDHPGVVWWNSEETVIPYRCSTDNKIHRYFVDITVKFKGKSKPFLIEIKPKKQTEPPKTPKRKTKRYLNEVMTYMKNESKWKAASSYCKNNGLEFSIWTEDTIKGLGIKLLT